MLVRLMFSKWCVVVVMAMRCCTRGSINGGLWPVSCVAYRWEGGGMGLHRGCGILWLESSKNGDVAYTHHVQICRTDELGVLHAHFPLLRRSPRAYPGSGCDYMDVIRLVVLMVDSNRAPPGNENGLKPRGSNSIPVPAWIKPDQIPICFPFVC